jgi:HD-like signal output (HDOD) protein
MPGNIEKLFAQVCRIPSIPEVVSRLVQELNLPNADFKAIAREVSHDQVIAMKVLRLANSAYFGLPRKLTAIDEAAMTLGMDRLKTLIIASGMVSSVPQMQGFNLKLFWTNSFRRATYSKGIASFVSGVDANTAFTCGLIADFGRLMVRMGAPSSAEKIDALIAAGGRRQDIEQAELGFTTPEIAGELCKRWSFPEVMQRAVAQSGDPLGFPVFDPLAACIHLADALCTLKSVDALAHDVPTLLPAAVIERLGIDSNGLQQIAYRVYDSESGLEALAA